MLHKVEGIVIRTINYGETNKIITIYTREKGKVSVMARGARKPKSRLSSVSQLFTYGQFMYQHTSGLGTLQQGEIISTMRVIREDLFFTAFAAYYVELTNKLTDENVPNGFLFEFLLQTLQLLCEGKDQNVLTFIFELKMLHLAGIQPYLNGCTVCHSTEGKFAFSIREGGFLCHRCIHKDSYALMISKQAVKLLRLFFYFDLSRLGDVSLKDETIREIRQVIDAYYEEYSGLYLKSKRFLDQIEKLT